MRMLKNLRKMMCAGLVVTIMAVAVPVLAYTGAGSFTNFPNEPKGYVEEARTTVDDQVVKQYDQFLGTYRIDSPKGFSVLHIRENVSGQVEITLSMHFPESEMLGLAKGVVLASGFEPFADCFEARLSDDKGGHETVTFRKMSRGILATVKGIYGLDKNTESKIFLEKVNG